MFVPYDTEIWTKSYGRNYVKLWAFWQKAVFFVLFCLFLFVCLFCFWNRFWQSADAILEDVSVAKTIVKLWLFWPKIQAKVEYVGFKLSVDTVLILRSADMLWILMYIVNVYNLEFQNMCFSLICFCFEAKKSILWTTDPRHYAFQTYFKASMLNSNVKWQFKLH